MVQCLHPFSALAISETTVAAGSQTVTIKLCCKSCGVPLLKEFLGRTPEPMAQVLTAKPETQ
jgi:hypothetical protein